MFQWLRRRKWPWFAGGALLIFVLWQLSANYYQKEQQELRQQVREKLKDQFPEQAEQYARTIGLFPYEAEAGERDRARGPVVLIHGMDDPGKVWRSLAPELARQGHAVWLMRYPDDQPVVESSRLFFEELQQLPRQGVDHISIVAHSMGGLVTRELLTSPDIAYRLAVEQGQVPRVDTFIMVAPPNHGSQLARFRVFGELRDQFVELTEEQPNWLAFIFDGAGEAKIDLLPGSRFLTELNGRPHPEGVEMLIIAGVTSPWDESDIEGWVDTIRDTSPAVDQQEIDTLKDYMVSVTHGLGDGLVTVDSTRLEGIAHLTVKGTHLTMIRNLTAESEHVPPAVPVIVERLAAGR